MVQAVPGRPVIKARRLLLVMPVTAHCSLDKGAHWMDVEMRHAPLTDAYVADVASGAGWGGALRIIDIANPAAPTEVGGHSVATLCHLGNIAVRTGKKVQWDPAKEQITGDAELAKWATKAYRAPWKLPAVRFASASPRA